MSFALICTTSCVQQEDLVAESTKSLEGNWHIAKVVQNSNDLTGLFDFSNFKIKFLKDPAGVQTYTIENPVPFAVNANGVWSLDDPTYPHNFILRENNSTVSKTIKFSFPIVNGKRNIRFLFNPGCTSVNYIYTLEQDSI